MRTSITESCMGPIHMFSDCDCDPTVLVGNRFIKRPRVPGGLIRTLLAVAVVFAASALFPNISQAESVIVSGHAAQSFLFENGACALDVFWGGMGSGSSSDEHQPAADKNPPPEEDRHPHRHAALPDAADCCGGTSGSPTVDGQSADGVGLVGESAAVAFSGPSGSMAHCVILIPPSPIPTVVLDPPKDVA